MSTHDKRVAIDRKVLTFAIVFGLAVVGGGLIWCGVAAGADSPRVQKLLVSLGSCCVAAGLGGFLLWQVVKRAW